MKKLLILCAMMIISGCSQPNMSTIYPDDKQMVIKGEGFMGLPMPFYDLSMKSQNYPRCHKKGFCSLLPQFKESDFKKLNHPWNMMTDENGYSVGIEQTLQKNEIVLGYSVQFSTSIMKYTERERALEDNDIAYMKTSKTWLKPTDIVTIEHHGKENYPCFVIETDDIKRGIKNKIYYCDKFNPERTMTKHITINISYTRVLDLPKELEQLAKEYTYEDLQERAQRVLDSLYIKDGWEKL